MSKPKTKQLKRVRGWAINRAGKLARLVELRSGEVVVDSERLVEAFVGEREPWVLIDAAHDLRAALRKVGVR